VAPSCRNFRPVALLICATPSAGRRREQSISGPHRRSRRTGAGRSLEREPLREVNELNLSLLGTRAMVTPGGWLILAGEVELESVEPGELGRLVGPLTEKRGAVRADDPADVRHG
jgi:hypothetical protein